MPRRWRPSRLLQLSGFLHGASAATLFASPQHWPWALGALAANHAVLTTAGLLPRCDWLGETWTRLPNAGTRVALTIDDGPDPELTPRVLDLLDHHQARASFFCIASQARAHPALLRDILARGHQVENHSDIHPHRFSLYGPGAMYREIARAQASLSELSGRAPRFFRSPAGLRNPFLDPVLARLDLTQAAWTRRAYDTRCPDPARILQRLTQHLAAGDILLLHDRHSARDPHGQAVILTVLPALLKTCQAQGLQVTGLEDASGEAESKGLAQAAG